MLCSNISRAFRHILPTRSLSRLPCRLTKQKCLILLLSSAACFLVYSHGRARDFLFLFRNARGLAAQLGASLELEESQPVAPPPDYCRPSLAVLPPRPSLAVPTAPVPPQFTSFDSLVGAVGDVWELLHPPSAPLLPAGAPEPGGGRVPPRLCHQRLHRHLHHFLPCATSKGRGVSRTWTRSSSSSTPSTSPRTASASAWTPKPPSPSTRPYSGPPPPLICCCGRLW